MGFEEAEMRWVGLERAEIERARAAEGGRTIASVPESSVSLERAVAIRELGASVGAYDPKDGTCARDVKEGAMEAVKEVVVEAAPSTVTDLLGPFVGLKRESMDSLRMPDRADEGREKLMRGVGRDALAAFFGFGSSSCTAVSLDCKRGRPQEHILSVIWLSAPQ
jgi:hypothetical protein